jgi:hypothetical protein
MESIVRCEFSSGVAASEERSRWTQKPRTLHCWKRLPSNAVKTVIENTSLCVRVMCKV